MRSSRHSSDLPRGPIPADDGDFDSGQDAVDPLWSHTSDPWRQPRKNRYASMAPMTVATPPLVSVSSDDDRSCGSDVGSDSRERLYAPLLSVCFARSPTTSLFAPTWVVPNFALFLRWLWKESCRQIIHRPEQYCGSGERSERPRPLTLWKQLENMVHGRSNTSVARPRKRGCEQPGE